MAYRLGIDMGTNSIGWCLWTLEETDGYKTPKAILDIGVRVFSDGRNPKNGDPLAVERRTARSMRRRRDRILERKRKLIRILVDSGYLSGDPEIRRKLSTLNPYVLRAKGLTDKLSNDEMARVLLHLATRRGFKSNRKDKKSDDKEVQGIKAGIKGLWTRIKEGGFRTLGEYLFRKADGIRRFKPGNEETFPDRAMYEQEFAEIRKFQEAFHKDLPWNKVERALYFQRPLRPVERGRCTFFPEEYRGWKALPSAQRFRYLQIILNLKKIDRQNNFLPLTPQEVASAIELFESRGEVSTSLLRRHLRLGNEITFNYQTQRNASTGEASEVKFKGNETMTRLRKSEKFSSWLVRQPDEVQDQVVENLIDFEEDDEASRYLRKTVPDLSDTDVEEILSVRLPEGTMSVSTKFMRQCNELMMRENLGYHEATRRIAGHHSDLGPKDQLTRLPYYGQVLRDAVVGAKPNEPEAEHNPELRFGRIMNPTVHVALNQLRKLINTIVDKHGAPEEIVLELSRELPMSAQQKRNLIAEQNKNREQNDGIRKKINSMWNLSEDAHRSRAEIQKYKLWVELNYDDPLNRCCVYCGRRITDSEFLGAETEVEHILPFSRTLMDGMHNLTVAHRTCNKAKGNQSPFEAFGHNPPGFNWEDILYRASRLPVGKRRKFTENAMADFDKDAGFITRQLTDNQYLSRISRRYLSHLVPDNKIWTVNGRLTADLRHAWGLNSILSRKGEKTRSDHRHHAMDAMTIALIDRRTVQLAARANQGKGQTGFSAPFVFPIGRGELVERFRRIYTSHKPDHGLGGALFLETAYGQIKVVEHIPIAEVRKKGFDTSKIVSDRLRSWVEDGALDPVPADVGSVAVFRNDWASRMEIAGIAKTDDIDRIVDPRIREQLRLATEGLKENSKDWKEALATYSANTGTKRVRYFPKNKEYVLLPRHGKIRLYKGYQVADYLCVDIWQVPAHTNKDGRKKSASFQGSFITRYQALKAQDEGKLKAGRAISHRPHPAAKFVCQLFKGDVLLLQGDSPESEPRLVRVAGFSARQNKLDVQPLNSSIDTASWIELTNSELVDENWKPVKGQNHVSINVLFAVPLAARKATISIDSKLSCR